MLEKNLEFLSDLELKKLVEERQNAVVKIISFVDSVDFIHKHGLLLSRSESNSHCTIKRQLNGFGAFDIYGIFGMTCMGGNQVDIKFKGSDVLKVYWQVSYDECRVDFFSECEDWLKEFNDMMNNAEKILMEMKQRQEQKQLDEENKKIELERKRNERDFLLKRAKDLGLK
jgi:uncharacterized protein (DUF342 family)